VANGSGHLILGDRGHDLNSYDIEDGNLTLRASNLLAFEPGLQLKQSIVPGFLTLIGTGTFLASSSGPVIFAEPPLRVDPQALVGWSDCPSPSHHYDAGWMPGFLNGTLGIMGRQSGEERQFDFTGAGTVLLQSSEQAVADPHLARQIEGQVAMLDTGGLQKVQRTVSQQLAERQQYRPGRRYALLAAGTARCAEGGHAVQVLRAFRGSIIASIVVLGLVGYFSGSVTLVLTALVLSVLEVSLSFDNAVVNAKYLKKMTPLWQKLFLTVGILIAVFGMRLVFPIVIVAITADLGFAQVIDLALNDGERYGEELEAAKPSIYAFGGTFLMMIFLDWVFGDKDVRWLRPVEHLFEKVGRFGQLSVLVAALLILVGASVTEASDSRTVLFSGLVGLATYLAVSGLDGYFDEKLEEDEDDESVQTTMVRGSGVAVQTAGKAGLSTFLYLEVLDASFSFDGVIGAFAISTNVLVIAAGLGIGALFVRSMTVYLVREGTLAQYRYLEHGAHWAIGGLALILFLELRVHIPEAITGLLGVTLIIASLISSVRANRKDATDLSDDELVGTGPTP